ncbi:MAG: DUF3971 domain-containing protein [Fimbriimonadaceae bacterium]
MARKGKLIALVAITVVGVASLALQSGPPYPLRLKDGSVEVMYWGGFAETLESGAIKLAMTGQPLTANLNDQGLQVRTSRIDGVVASDSQGNNYLQTATLTGNVNVDLDQNMANGSGDMTLQTDRVAFAEGANEAKVTVPGRFTFTENSQTSGGTRNVTLRGNSGEFSLVPLRNEADERLRTANVRGNVQIDFVLVAADGERTVINATADRLTADGPARVYRLLDSVSFEIDTPDFDGITGSTNQMTIELADDYTLERFTTGGGVGGG